MYIFYYSKLRDTLNYRLILGGVPLYGLKISPTLSGVEKREHANYVDNKISQGEFTLTLNSLLGSISPGTINTCKNDFLRVSQRELDLFLKKEVVTLEDAKNLDNKV